MLGGLLCAFLLLEGGIRLYYGNNPIWMSPQVAHEVTDYGFRPVPNQSGVFSIDMPVTTNHHGFRDKEWRLASPKKHTRILIVGDSFTFGNGVEQNKIFPSQLEASLGSAEKKYDVFNASAGGWNINEIVGFVTQEGLSLKADILIYAFFYNDYDNGPSQPRQLSSTGRIESRPSWLSWLPYNYIYLLKRSALIWMIRDRVGILFAEKDETTKILDNSIRFDDFSRKDYTNNSIKNLMELSNANDIKFVLAVIPPINSKNPMSFKPEYLSNLSDLVLSHGGYFHDFTDTFFKNSDDIKDLYLWPWDNHLSAKGHKFIADELAQIVTHLDQHQQ